MSRTSLVGTMVPLFGIILGIYFLLFSGLVYAGELSGGEISYQSTADVDDINALSESPKLNGPSSILKGFLNGGFTTRVIVNLRKPAYANQLRDFTNMTVRQQLQEAVRESQDNLIDTLDLQEIRITNMFTYIFGFSGEVTLQGLQELVDNPSVVSIEEDDVNYINLAQGIPLMNASTARTSYNGSGLAIAIVDTGIDYTHSRLGGGGFPNSKVIGGYDTGDNDADPMDQQGHGTGCAGVAAGNLGTVGDYIGGVAPGAKLYALKITRGGEGSATASDQIEAWEWCITHQYDDPSNPIMIISMSFGGGRYKTACDGVWTARAAAVANVVAAGMTIFFSSGNSGYCDSIGSPACISQAISVGAVYDASLGRNPPTGKIGCIKNGSCVGTPSTICDEKQYVDQPANADQVTTYSNTASFLDLLAPANWATTTKLGGGYWDTPNGFGGTSAATPYVAGAAAVLQSAAKSKTGSYLTPAQVKSKLVGTGDLITDSKAVITKPRVNLGAAINSLSGGSTLYVDPSGSCGGNTPCYTTIQAAINAAGSGVVIKIKEGCYNENIVLNTAKEITLDGGWNASFTSQSSNSIVKTLKRINGTIIVNRMVTQQ